MLMFDVLYRPPGDLRELLNELETLIIKFLHDGSPLYVLGDFNLLTSAFD